MTTPPPSTLKGADDTPAQAPRFGLIDGNTFYVIKLRTDRSHLGTDEKPLLIIPGMVASVDIITGKKSVLSYLLKPIIRARAEALRER